MSVNVNSQAERPPDPLSSLRMSGYSIHTQLHARLNFT